MELHEIRRFESCEAIWEYEQGRDFVELMSWEYQHTPEVLVTERYAGGCVTLYVLSVVTDCVQTAWDEFAACFSAEIYPLPEIISKATSNVPQKWGDGEHYTVKGVGYVADIAWDAPDIRIGLYLHSWANEADPSEGYKEDWDDTLDYIDGDDDEGE